MNTENAGKTSPSLWRRIGSDIAEKWEIYLLLGMSVLGITLHYLHIPETKPDDDPFEALKTLQHTLTYLILMICLLSIHLLRQESKNQKRLSSFVRISSFEHTSLEDALKIARSGKSNFKRVRILASTTANIQPILMTTNNITIATCNVILVQKNLDIAGKFINERVATFVEAWIDNKNSGKIASLSIKGYSFIPLLYLIIIDESAMILGLLTEDTARHVRMDVGEPIIIKDSTAEGVKLITKWTEWFDRLDARLPVHADFHQQLLPATIQANAIAIKTEE